MNALKEKITFYITGFVYFMFNLRYSPDVGEMTRETLLQLISTIPYVAGITYIFVYFLRHVAGGEWPPWDRIFRIFFTFGIIIGFFFSLYEYAEMGQKLVQ